MNGERVLYISLLICSLLLCQQHELQPSCFYVVELSQSRRLVCSNSTTCRSENTVKSMDSFAFLWYLFRCSYNKSNISGHLFHFVLCSLALSAAVWLSVSGARWPPAPCSFPLGSFHYIPPWKTRESWFAFGKRLLCATACFILVFHQSYYQLISCTHLLK